MTLLSSGPWTQAFDDSDDEGESEKKKNVQSNRGSTADPQASDDVVDGSGTMTQVHSLGPSARPVF